MISTVAPSAVFTLPRRSGRIPHVQAINLGCRLLERLSGLNTCERIYQTELREVPAERFPAAVLDTLQIDTKIAPADLARVPRQGPAILVANHPFGAVEGVVLMDLLQQVRPDVRIMANYHLARVPQLQQRLIRVDPFQRDSSARSNLAPLRSCLDWLRSGGLLVVFPAGEVSSWQRRQRTVTDPTWSRTLARLVRLSEAAVVPVYFPGRNSLAFQLAGIVSPLLRTLLLPRQLLNKRGRTVELLIGRPLAARRLGQLGDDRQLTDYLRSRCYFLAARNQAARRAEPKSPPVRRPLAEAIPAGDLERELAELPAACRLLESGPQTVYLASAEQMTLLLLEIGRLREQTFRAVGEGTGLSRDIDPFDGYYRHLFIWHRDDRRIVGAYRIGVSDEILQRFGRDGLYTSTLFHYRDELLKRLDPALELGRSFIHPDYQRSFSSLLLLWKGIGAYVARNPRYRYLFGPVSISRDYRDASRQLIVSGLHRHFSLDGLARLVRPRLPVRFRPLGLKGSPERWQDLAEHGMDEIDTLVADLEADGKGIPVLLRQYLNLGGRLLAFNLDPDFSDVIDGLLLVDLLQTDEKQLVRYLGREGAAAFRAAHQPELRDAGRSCA